MKYFIYICIRCFAKTPLNSFLILACTLLAHHSLIAQGQFETAYMNSNGTSGGCYNNQCVVETDVTNPEFELVFDSDIGNGFAFIEEINFYTTSTCEALYIFYSTPSEDITLGPFTEENFTVQLNNAVNYMLVWGDFNNVGEIGLQIGGYAYNPADNSYDILDINKSIRSESDNDASISFEKTGSIEIKTKNLSRFLVRENGKIGIGSVNPNEKLHVMGKIRSQEAGEPFYLDVGAVGSPENMGIVHSHGGQIISSDNEGNINIGSNSSNGKVSLHNNTKVNGSIDAQSYLLNGQQLTSGIEGINSTSGNIGIGTTNTHGYKLAVAGSIITEEVNVSLQENWPDYVFDEDYELMSINELKSYLKKYSHLPDIPSEQEVSDNGILVGEINAKLLKKIEELTLYIIKQEDQITALKESQQNVVELLAERIYKIEKQLSN